MGAAPRWWDGVGGFPVPPEYAARLSELARAATVAEPDPPAQRHSPTSVAAAEAIRRRAPSARERVFAVIRAAGECGATDEEIAEVLPMNPSTVRPRRVELIAAGLVRDSGRVRATRSGRLAVVWFDAAR